MSATQEAVIGLRPGGDLLQPEAAADRAMSATQEAVIGLRSGGHLLKSKTKEMGL